MIPSKLGNELISCRKMPEHFLQARRKYYFGDLPKWRQNMHVKVYTLDRRGTSEVNIAHLYKILRTYDKLIVIVRRKNSITNV